MDKEQQQNNSQPEQAGCLTIIIRLAWMILGNGILFFMAVFIVQKRAGILLDLVFWAVVAGLILTRYIDIKVFQGLTADNKPATLKDWRKYTLMLIVISALVWLVAHGAANVL
jgi:hypothetical protein